MTNTNTDQQVSELLRQARLTINSRLTLQQQHQAIKQILRSLQQLGYPAAVSLKLNLPVGTLLAAVNRMAINHFGKVNRPE